METDVRAQEEEEEDRPREHEQESVEGEAGADVEPSAPPLEAATATPAKHKVVLTVQELPAIKRAVSSALRLNRRMAYEIKEVAEHEVEDMKARVAATAKEEVLRAEEAELEEGEGEEDEEGAGARTRRRAAVALQELGSVDDHQMAAEGSPPRARSRRRRAAWWRLLFCAKKEAAGESSPPEPHQEEN